MVSFCPPSYVAGILNFCADQQHLCGPGAPCPEASETKRPSSRQISLQTHCFQNPSGRNPRAQGKSGRLTGFQIVVWLPRAWRPIRNMIWTPLFPLFPRPGAAASSA